MKNEYTGSVWKSTDHSNKTMAIILEDFVLYSDGDIVSSDEVTLREWCKDAENGHNLYWKRFI